MLRLIRLDSFFVDLDSYYQFCANRHMLLHARRIVDLKGAHDSRSKVVPF